MHTLTQMWKEFSGPLLAVLCGVYAFRYFNSFWKGIFLLTLLYLVFLYFAYVVTPPTLTNPNAWLYNIYIFMEMIGLCAMSFFIITSKAVKRLIVFLLLFFIAAYSINIYYSGTANFANYAGAAESLAVSIIYCYVLYSDFGKNSSWWLSPISWCSAGLIVYFTCSVPYMSLYNVLNDQCSETSQVLFQSIVDVLALIRYIFLAIAFWLLRRQTAKPATSTT